MSNGTKTAEWLLELGFCPQNYGFGYLVDAVSKLAENMAGYYARTFDIYDVLYKDFGVKREKASRSMYYSIITAWQMPENEELRKMLPMDKGGYPPSTVEFICRMAMILNRRLNNEFFDLSSTACGQDENCEHAAESNEQTVTVDSQTASGIAPQAEENSIVPENSN